MGPSIIANLACITRKKKSNCPDLLKPKISNFCLQLFPNGHAVYKAQDVVLLDGTPKELSADLDILWNKIISDTMTSVLRGPVRTLAHYFGLNWTKAYDAFEKAEKYLNFLFAVETERREQEIGPRPRSANLKANARCI